MRRTLLVALVLAVTLGAVALVAVTRRDNRASSLEAAADELVAEGVPGVLVRLHAGDDVDEFARGAASPHDRFRVGSVTKTFVAVLALTLADRGVLSLDDPVSRYVPGLLRDGDRVTVRQLLDHTAGLYDYTLDRELLDGDLTPRGLVAIADARPRSHGYVYSSTNYLALGLVLEAAAGESLADLLRTRVFGPLGLEDTAFEPGRVQGRHLHGHVRASRDGVATGRLRDTEASTALSHWAAGAVVSTASDLDRFFSDILADGLGRRLAPRAGASYGLGVARLPTGCGSMIGHTGNILGTVSIVGKRGDRLLVVVANVYPLTPAQEAALRELLDRGLCG
jgi:D-alanyl-D-alanine carboxypeptidase